MWKEGLTSAFFRQKAQPIHYHSHDLNRKQDRMNNITSSLLRTSLELLHEVTILFSGNSPDTEYVEYATVYLSFGL